MDVNLDIVKKEITLQELIKEEIIIEEFSTTIKNEKIEATECFIEKHDYEALVQDSQITTDTFLCGHCYYSSFTKKVLEKHIKCEHLKPYSFVCRHCNIKCCEYILKSQLKQNNKQLCCIKCYFSSKPAPKRQEYLCSVCEKTFKWKETLNIHFRIHTGEKPYICKICQYKTGDKVNFNRHSRIHKSERNHACPQCPFKTYRKDNLTVHLRIHSGEKNFACDQCEFRALRKESLIFHIKSHSKAPSNIREKNFACQICNYKTSYKCHLTRHLKNHTGEKPYKCKICKYKSSERCKLKIHLRTHL